MKLRLMGPPDIVELWAARFTELGVGGRHTQAATGMVS